MKPDADLSAVEDLVVRDELANKMNEINGFTGDDELEPDDEIVDSIAKSMDLDNSDDAEDDIESTSDDELKLDELDIKEKEAYYDAILKKKTGYEKNELSQRDKLLREKQKQIKIKGATIEELTKELDVPQLNTVTVTPPADLKVINPNVTDVKFANFEKEYNETLFPQNMAEVITCFNDKSINVNVMDVKVEDISDNLNMEEQYTITMEDELRRRHTMKVNIPKFIDNRFLYLNGSKKTIQKQFMGMPVIKTAPDTVQICTNYNKIFIYRRGSRFNPNMENLESMS